MLANFGCFCHKKSWYTFANVFYLRCETNIVVVYILCLSFENIEQEESKSLGITPVSVSCRGDAAGLLFKETLAD